MSALGGAGSPIAANTALVTLVGRVPVKVSLENGSILIGDPLTSSSVPGVAMKATRPGPIIGKALASYTQATTDNKIMVYVSLGWNGQDAPLSLTADGQVNIDSNIDPAILTSLGYQLTPTAKSSVYTVTDSLGNLVHTISTDLLSAKTLVANLTLSNTSISKEVKVTGNLEATTASVSGTLTASDIQATSVTATTINSTDASVSGTLYADQIISKDGSLSDVMNSKVASLRTDLQTVIANSLITNNLAGASVGHQ